MNTASSQPPMPEEDRGPFLRRTFGTVLVCMLFTSAFFATVVIIPEVTTFFETQYYIGYVALGILGGFGFLLIYSVKSRPRSPLIIISLGGLVIAMCLTYAAFMIGRLRLHIASLAVIATTVVVLVCFGLSFTKMDFSKYWVYVIASTTALAAFGLVMVVATQLFDETFQVLHIALGALFTLIQSVILILQVQLVLKGKFDLGEGVDRLMAGAVFMYLFIMTIVLIILELACGRGGGSD